MLTVDSETQTQVISLTKTGTLNSSDSPALRDKSLIKHPVMFTSLHTSHLDLIHTLISLKGSDLFLKVIALFSNKSAELMHKTANRSNLIFYYCLLFFR